MARGTLDLEALVPLAPAILVGGGQSAHGTPLVVIPVVCTVYCPLHPFGHVGGGRARLVVGGEYTPPLIITTRDVSVHAHHSSHPTKHWLVGDNMLKIHVQMYTRITLHILQNTG